MRLLGWELRKIWQPGVIVAIILLGMVYYWIRPAFYIEYFCNGPYGQAEFDLSAEWLAQYGTTIEADERLAIGKEREEAIAEFNRKLSAIDEAAAEGIYSYDDFSRYQDQSDNSVLIWQIIEGTNWFTLQALDNFLTEYDQSAQPTRLRNGGNLADKYYKRVDVLVHSPASKGILPGCVRDSTNEYAKYLAIWCVLSVIILLSPTLVRDKLYRMQPCQWSSRWGRYILHKQMQAALLSSLALTLINIVIYSIPFWQTGALIFGDCWLYSLWPHWYPWFDWTYSQYLLTLTGLVLVLAMAAAALAVVLSQYSNNYVAMVLKALPLFVILGWFVTRAIMEQAAFLGNRCSRWLNLPRAEFFCAGFLLLLSLALCLNTGHRQRRQEL